MPHSAPTPAPLIARETSSARSSAAVSVGFLLTSVLGGIMTLLVAVIVGEGAETDAFFAAYSVYLFFTLFGTGLRTALVPLLGSQLDERAWRIRAADVAGRLSAAGAAAAGVVIVLSPVLGIALRPGDAGGRSTAVLTLAILAVASYCQIASAALAAVLAGASRFGVSAILYVLAAGSMLILGGTLMLLFGIVGAPLGVLGGASVLLAGHYAYLRRFDFRAPPLLRKLGEAQTWRFVRLASAGSALPLAQQLQLTIALAFVSVVVGAVAAYTYASFIAVLLTSVTVYVVAFVMLPGLLAAIQSFGEDAVQEYLDFAVPLAFYLYVAGAGTYAAFGRPIVDLLLGGSLSSSNLDLLWDASRVFLAMSLGAAIWVPISIVCLARRRYAALVVPAIGVLAIQLVAVALVRHEGTLAIAIAHAGTGAMLTVAVPIMGFGYRAATIILLRLLRLTARILPVALVIPALALAAPTSDSAVAAVALATLAGLLYFVVGFLVWPRVGRRAALMLIAREHAPA